MVYGCVKSFTEFTPLKIPFFRAEVNVVNA